VTAPPTAQPVVRQWRARATPDGARAYEAHFRSAVLADLAAVDGWLGAHLLVREEGGEVELVTLVWFESLDAVRRFAGADLERAVVAPEARRVLRTFDERVTHYRLAADAPPQPS
jgi:heme-degrading monooxygenase HmoA